MTLLCSQVHKQIEIVIKKGRGIRPDEALATLYFIKKVLHSTTIKLWADNQRNLPKYTFLSNNVFNSL